MSKLQLTLPLLTSLSLISLHDHAWAQSDSTAPTPTEPEEKAPADAQQPTAEDNAGEAPSAGNEDTSADTQEDDAAEPAEPAADAPQEEVAPEATPQAAPEAEPAPPAQEEEIVVGSGAASYRAENQAAAASNESLADAGQEMLKEDELVEEEEIIIAGTRSSRMAGAVQVIGKKQLERTEYDDAHAILRQVPGVFVREEDGTGLRPNIAMRGVNPDRSKKITLMEDGILFGPAPYSAPAAYYFPLMTRMTQVQVIKGPGAVAFGPQTVAGAIDLRTRQIPTRPSLSVDVALGQYGYNKAHAFAGASNEQWGFLIEGTHLGNSGFKELPNGANTGATRDEWMMKASYLVDPRAETSNEFSLKLGYSQEASNETYLGLTDDDFEENPNRRYPASNLDRLDNYRTAIVFSHELKSYKKHLELLTSIYRNDLNRSWNKFNHLGGASAAEVLNNPDDPQNAAYLGVLRGESDTSGPLDTLYIGPNKRVYVSQGISSRVRWSPSSKHFAHKLEAGVRLHQDSIERDHSESGYAMLGGDLYPTDEATIQTTSNRDSTHALAVHLTDAVTWKALTITPGVRVEAIYSQSEDFSTGDKTDRVVVGVMPGLGAYVALTDSLGVLGGAYRGFSPPAPGADDTVKPEMSINYEAGVRYAERTTKAEVIGFFNDYSNMTDVCTFSSGCINADLDRQFDAGRAFIYGMEALAAYEPKWGPVTFPLSAAYTLSFGEFRNDFISADPVFGTVEVGDEMPYLPRHQFNATAGLQVGVFEAYTVTNYVAPTREQGGDEDLDDVMSTDPLVTLDVGVSVQALKFFKVYVNARNLLDYQSIVSHRPYGARPNAPRWIQAGIKMDL